MQISPKIKDIVSLLGSRVLAQVVALSTGFITARVLGPKDFGLWSMLGLIFTCGYFSDLGVFAALRRQIPYLKAVGKESEITPIVNTGFWLVIFSSLIVTLIIFFISRFFSVDPPLMNNMRIAAIIFLFIQTFNFLKSISWAKREFILQSKSEILYSFSYLLLVIFFIRSYRIYGLLVSMLLSTLIALGYLFRYTELKLHFQLSYRHARVLLKLGLQLFISSVIFTIYNTLDKLLVIRFFSRDIFGIYAITYLCSVFLSLFSGVIRDSFEPYSVLKYAVSKDDEFKSYLISIQHLLSYSVCIPIGLAWLLVGPVVRLFLPAYIPAIIPAKIIIFSHFFSALSVVQGQYFVTIGRPYKGIPFLVFGIVCGLTLGYTFIVSGWQIKGVTISTFITYFLSVILFSMYIFRGLKMGLRTSVFKLAELFWPFFYTLACLFFLEKIFSFFVNSLFIEITKAIFFLIFSLPLIYSILKQKQRLTHQKNE